MQITVKANLILFTTVMMLALVSVAQGTNVIQIDVAAVLNARAVGTFTNGKIVPLSADVDGAGGVVTKAVAEKLGNSTTNALPDDGKFPATDAHPEVVLNFSNGDGEHNQVRRSEGVDEFSFDVPKKRYSQIFLFLSSGHFGPAKVEIKLFYKDGTSGLREMEVPDWYFTLKPGETDRCYLATDLGKWNKENKMIEKNHHFIFGLNASPASDKVLTKVQLHKFGTCVLAFWGATGVTVE